MLYRPYERRSTTDCYWAFLVPFTVWFCMFLCSTIVRMSPLRQRFLYCCFRLLLSSVCSAGACTFHPNILLNQWPVNKRRFNTKHCCFYRCCCCGRSIRLFVSFALYHASRTIYRFSFLTRSNVCWVTIYWQHMAHLSESSKYIILAFNRQYVVLTLNFVRMRARILNENTLCCRTPLYRLFLRFLFYIPHFPSLSLYLSLYLSLSFWQLALSIPWALSSI